MCCVLGNITCLQYLDAVELLLLKLCVCLLFRFVVIKICHCWYNLALVHIAA